MDVIVMKEILESLYDFRCLFLKSFPLVEFVFDEVVLEKGSCLKSLFLEVCAAYD